MLQGFHIITYALHIYYLNLFIAFLTPKVEPMTYDDEDDEDAGSLPTSNQSEFKPFIRRLPEFKVTIYHFYAKIIIKNSFGGGQHVPQLLHLHVLSLNFSMYQYSGQFWSCILLCSSLLRWKDSSNIWSNINMFPGLLERRNFRAKMTREM